MENKSIFKDTSFYIALAILISGILISAAIPVEIANKTQPKTIKKHNFLFISIFLYLLYYLLIFKIR